jgi:hypothetical protein
MPDEISDLIQIGASAGSRATLDHLQEHGHIADLMDGYRLAIATAISFGREPREKTESDRVTMFATGNLDPDMAIKTAVMEIYPRSRTWPYRAAEDLAEQGLEILEESLDGEQISYTNLLERIEAANPAAPIA